MTEKEPFSQKDLEELLGAAEPKQKVEVPEAKEKVEKEEKVEKGIELGEQEKIAEAYETAKSFLEEKWDEAKGAKRTELDKALESFGEEERTEFLKSLADRPKLQQEVAQEGIAFSDVKKIMAEALEGRSKTGKYRKVFKAYETLEKAAKVSTTPPSEDRIRLEAYFISKNSEHIANKGKEKTDNPDENWRRAKEYLEKRETIPRVSEETIKKIHEKQALEEVKKTKVKAEKEALKKVRKELGEPPEKAEQAELTERMEAIRLALLEKYDLPPETSADEFIAKVLENWDIAKKKRAEADPVKVEVGKIEDLNADAQEALKDQVRAKVLEAEPKTPEEAEKIAKEELAKGTVDRIRTESLKELERKEKRPGFMEAIRNWFKKPYAKLIVIIGGALIAGSALRNCTDIFKTHEAQKEAPKILKVEKPKPEIVHKHEVHKKHKMPERIKKAEVISPVKVEKKRLELEYEKCLLSRALWEEKLGLAQDKFGIAQEQGNKGEMGIQAHLIDDATFWIEYYKNLATITLDDITK